MYFKNVGLEINFIIQNIQQLIIKCSFADAIKLNRHIFDYFASFTELISTERNSAYVNNNNKIFYIYSIWMFTWQLYERRIINMFIRVSECLLRTTVNSNAEIRYLKALQILQISLSEQNTLDWQSRVLIRWCFPFLKNYCEIWQRTLLVQLICSTCTPGCVIKCWTPYVRNIFIRQTQEQIAREVHVPRGSLRDHGIVSAWRGVNFLLHDGIPTTCRVISAWTRGVVVRCRAVDAFRPLENICTVEIIGRHSSSLTGAKIKRHRSWSSARLPKRTNAKSSLRKWRVPLRGKDGRRSTTLFQGDFVLIKCGDMARNMERATRLKHLRFWINIVTRHTKSHFITKKYYTFAFTKWKQRQFI